MNLWTIALRSLTQRSLSTMLTGLSMALGVMLVVGVLVVYGIVTDAFQRNASLGYDMIVGAKGGRLQLVLNTVYHLSSPVENLPYSYYREFRDGQYSEYVDRVIPLCMGDSYQEFRVVATVPELFEIPYVDDRTYAFADGRNFEVDHFFEAVIGSVVAVQTGLKVGDTFEPTHGVSDEQDGHAHDPFRVVGILEPTGTPNDRALFVNMEGFYLLEDHAKPGEGSGEPNVDAHDHDHGDGEGHDHEGDDHDGHAHDHNDDDHSEHDDDHEHAGHDHGNDADHKHDAHDHDEHAHDDHVDHAGHDHEGHDHSAHGHDDHADHAGHGHEGHDHSGHAHEPLPESQREVTALLVKAKGFEEAIQLPNLINEGLVGQAVSPVREISMLFGAIVDPIEYLLLGLTILIVIVSAVGILVSLVNSMNDRKIEIAVMRALGARRVDILVIVLLESVLLASLGAAIGWLLGHGLLAALGPLVTRQTGIPVGAFSLVWSELALIPIVIGLALVAGYLPARMAYKTDVGRALVAN